jgi:CheY-like chemotaxis protein
MQAAERGSRLTGQLLAFSRVQKLDLRPVEVTPLITEMLDLFSRTLGTSVHIVTDLADAGAAVLADKTQLELALLNLAINARDAMPEGGTLTVATKADPDCDPKAFPDGCVEISVTDTGAGMSPEIVARAFEPFFTTKGVGKGTGLGLSMVYGVARQSGGDARIDSSPGRGTTVYSRLRRAATPVVSGADAAGARTGSKPGAGETVLVVDDDADVRGAVANALEALDYRVQEAESGPEALRLLEAGAPALAILDFAMPGMNGAELAREARRLHPDLPIVFASGYADTDALRSALGSNMPLLRKPFRMEELAALVGSLLAKSG